MSDTPDPSEPADEDFQAWLATPEGAAAMKQVMQDVVAGKHGELTPELIQQARDALHQREVIGQVEHVHERRTALAGLMSEEPQDWVENSRWAHVHALNEESKAILDLALELPEPYRTPLMKQVLPLQQRLESVLGGMD